MSFVYHPHTQTWLPGLKIHALGILENNPFEVPLFPGAGMAEETEDEMRMKGRIRLPFGLELELIGSCRSGCPFARFDVAFCNSDTKEPPGNLRGVVGVRVIGEEPHIDSRPLYRNAHGVQTWNTVFQDAMQLAEGNIADQQYATVSFIVAFGPNAKQIAAKEVVYPTSHVDVPSDALDAPVPFLNVDEHEFAFDWLHLLETPRAVNDLLGPSPTPNQSGAQGRFGWFPEPYLVWYLSGESIALVKATLMRAEDRWPRHVNFMRHIAVPDTEAIYFAGSLSTHSRNRLGRPIRNVSPPEEWAKFTSGYHDGIYAPGGEWATSALPQLAWFGDEYWAKMRCMELGFWVMNQTHLGIGIKNGGYDTPYLQHQRAFWRLVRLLFQCWQIAKREGWANRATAFEAHIAQMFGEAVKRWKPDFYGIQPRNKDEWVVGHETEKTIAAWQVFGLPIAFRFWKETGNEHAKTMLEDLSRVLLTAYVRLNAQTWGMRKIVLAERPEIGWDPAVSLHGIEYWPHASLKLCAQVGGEFGLSAPEQDKAMQLTLYQEDRYDGLKEGGTYRRNTSNWACGDFSSKG